MTTRLAPIAAASLLLAHAAHATELIVHSPAEFADAVAEAVASGPCGTAAAPVVLDHSTLVRTLVDFPADFLGGLVPAIRFGHTSYPISVQLDAATGAALFRNAEETVFYTVVPPPGSLPLASLLPPGTDPAGVVIHWRVLPQSDEPGPRRRSPPRPRSEDPSTRTPRAAGLWQAPAARDCGVEHLWAQRVGEPGTS